MRLPAADAKPTRLTPPRWLPLMTIFEPATALRRPAHLAAQVTSLRRGGCGTPTPPPPPATAEPVPRLSEATAAATPNGTARIRFVPRTLRVGLNGIPLSRACGVSCRARDERASLRAIQTRFAPVRRFDAGPVVPPLPAVMTARIRQLLSAAVYPRPPT